MKKVSNVSMNIPRWQWLFCSPANPLQRHRRLRSVQLQDTLTFLINEHHQEVTRYVIGQKLSRFEIYAHVHKLYLRNKMPGSRRRKRQMAANRRQLGRARRKIQREGRGKENNGSLLQDCGSNSSLENRPVLTSDDEAAGVRGWWDSLYNWCHASLTQVCSLWMC